MSRAHHRGIKGSPSSQLRAQLAWLSLGGLGLWLMSSLGVWRSEVSLERPLGSHLTLSATLHNQKSALGWLTQKQTDEGWRVERAALIPSAQGGEATVTRARFELSQPPPQGSGWRLLWRSEAGDQVTQATVEVTCLDRSAEEERAEGGGCRLSLQGGALVQGQGRDQGRDQGRGQGRGQNKKQGEGQRVGTSRLSSSSPPPLVSELWPWMLPQERCAQLKAGDRGTSQRYDLFKPFTKHLIPQGLSLSCLSPREGSKKGSREVTRVARYEIKVEGGALIEWGEVWWGQSGEVRRWEAHLGALTLTLSASDAELNEPLKSAQAKEGEPHQALNLKAEATPKIISELPQRSPPSARSWATRSWARLALRAHDAQPLKLLESHRQVLDQSPTNVTLVKRGPSLRELSPEPNPKLSPEPSPERSEVGSSPPLISTTPHPLKKLERTPPELLAVVEQVAPLSLSEPARALALWWWVRRNIEVSERVGVPRPLETLALKRGDCNEHSALLQALYLAAELKAEQVFGLIALGDRAGYHAWVRVWLEGRWVEVDSSRGLDYASAGHWAISAGDAEAQEALAPLLFNSEVILKGWGR